MTRRISLSIACVLLGFSVVALSRPPRQETKGPAAEAPRSGPGKPAPSAPLTPPPAPPALTAPAAPESKTPAPAAGSISLSGRVTLPAGSSAPVKNQRYKVVSSGKVLATDPALAVVYLEGTFPAPATAPRAVMHQKDFMFQPAILPVQTGTVVAFPNEDDTYHNVFSYSKAKRFDLGRYLPTETPVPSQTFDKAGLVQLHCEIHEHMRAVILVLDTPYFTVTDSAGNFRLNNLPPGNFKLKAWLNSALTKEQAITLSQGVAGRADFP